MLYSMCQRLFGTPNSLRVLAELVSDVRCLRGTPLVWMAWAISSSFRAAALRATISGLPASVSRR
jgi:hypothetical protein